MASHLAQALVDLEAERAERAYELWRSWAAQHELEQTERRLSQGGLIATDRDGESALPDFLRRWALGVALGAALWALLFLLARWLW